MDNNEPNVLVPIKKIKPGDGINADKLVKIVDDLKKYMLRDGGNIDYEKYEDTKLYVKFSGACVGCPLQDFEVSYIEKLIKEKFYLNIEVVAENAE
jgi:Fe-S cluster biogenesis protein NfuA